MCLDTVFYIWHVYVGRRSQIEMSREMANMIQSSCSMTIVKTPSEEMNSMDEIPVFPILTHAVASLGFSFFTNF